MKTSNNGKAFIKHFEGLMLSRYRDVGGVATIGYGHTGSDLPTSITEEQAEAYFEQDVEHAEDAVDTLVEVPVTQNQFDALVDFVFNLGEAALRRSTMLRLLNASKASQAALEFPKWVYVNGRAVHGLEERRSAEKKLFETPDGEEDGSDSR